MDKSRLLGATRASLLLSLKKIVVSAAIAATMSASTSGAMAATIVTMDITDVDGDSISGGFAFDIGTSTVDKYNYFFDSTTNPVTGGDSNSYSNGDGLIQADGLPESTESFTGGFAFLDGIFLPSTQDATGTGTAFNASPAGGISGTVTSGATTMNMSEFVWSARFIDASISADALFPMSPDSGFSTNIVGQGLANCATGSSAVCYQLRWEHYIEEQDGFFGDTVWQIEGVAILDGAVTLQDFGTVPVPAAVWLFGTGLLGLIGIAKRKKAA